MLQKAETYSLNSVLKEVTHNKQIKEKDVFASYAIT